MYSEEDINSAVAAGALSADAAADFRAHVSTLRDLPRGDEENFRLVNSFNDVFVTIGVVILLLAVGSIGAALAGPLDGTSFAGGLVPIFLPGALVAGTAWFLAEAFTRRRRMALPSIVLLITFLGAVFAAALAVISLPVGLIAGVTSFNDRAMEKAGIGDAMAAVLIVLVMLATGAFTAFAARLHWRRFMVPITIAAGAGAVAGSVIAAITLAHEAVTGDGDPQTLLLPLVLVCGLAIFAFAMRWDMSDRDRLTRRSDVAFWLHLLAAPMIAHPLFYSLGVMKGGGAVGVGGALGVLAIYVLFGLVALAIDRRALLVSALAYVLAALTFLFDRFGAVELTFALTALVIGSALLTLSAFWAPIRAQVVGWLPGAWQVRLPVAGTVGAPVAA